MRELEQDKELDEMRAARTWARTHAGRAIDALDRARLAADGLEASRFAALAHQDAHQAILGNETCAQSFRRLGAVERDALWTDEARIILEGSAMVARAAWKAAEEAREVAWKKPRKSPLMAVPEPVPGRKSDPFAASAAIDEAFSRRAASR